MAQPRKQDTTTGNGYSKTPILAQEKDLTAVQSKPSQQPTSIAVGSTKPVSIPEALSLLQTLCLDLRSLGCETSILARNGRIYVISNVPPDTGAVGMSDTGHILLDSKPVLLG